MAVNPSIFQNSYFKIFLAITMVVLLGLAIFKAIEYTQEKESSDRNSTSFELKFGARGAESQDTGGDSLYAVPYELDSLLDQSELSTTLFRADDIDTCDWEEGEIVLDKQASERVRKMYADDSLAVEGLFEVILNNERIFGGALIYRGSARAIDYPVMYLELNENNVSITLKSSHHVASHNYEDDTYYPLMWTSEFKEFCKDR